MKFGGSCLRDKEAFNKICKISNIYSGVSKVYVASALNGITDLLLKMAQNYRVLLGVTIQVHMMPITILRGILTVGLKMLQEEMIERKV